MNLYYERGKLPQPDLLIDGTKYWSRSTAVKYRGAGSEKASTEL